MLSFMLIEADRKTETLRCYVSTTPEGPMKRARETLEERQYLILGGPSKDIGQNP